MTVTDNVIIRVEGARKIFGLTKAVNDVSIEVKKGEVLGLIGENGSGKSTLVSMISGRLKPDAGEFFYLGEPYTPTSLLDARRRGICILVQEQGTIDGLSVSDNIFLGREGSLSKIGNINRAKMSKETNRIFADLGIEGIDPNINVDFLSFEDRKLVEIATSMYTEPKLLIVDETSTALSQKGRKLIYKIIEKMKNAGNAVIFISHDLEEVTKVCDTITVLRDGCLVDTREVENLSIDDIKKMMIGRDLSGKYYRADKEESHQEEISFEVSGISYAGFLKDISFSTHKGEIFGIGGLTECGMHELCKIMFGAIKPDSGTVTIKKTGHEIVSPEQAVKEGIAFIPKDRDRESAFQNTSIMDNIVAASMDNLRQGIFISKKSEVALATEYATQMNVKMSGINQHVKALSGGNKQKVVLAKWLANDSDILIMDCPTRGIDVGVKAAIYRLMEKLKDEGKTIIMVSEELTELIGMSDRILILRNGRMNGIFSRSEDISEHTLITRMI